MIGPFEQHDYYISKDYPRAYRVFVRHEKEQRWSDVLNNHRNNFDAFDTSAIVPLKGCGDNWETYAIMILYTLSIIVRYRPNLWRRIESGEWDKYLSVFLNFASIVEKTLPHIFFEKIYGKKLYIRSTGSFY